MSHKLFKGKNHFFSCVSPLISRKNAPQLANTHKNIWLFLWIAVVLFENPDSLIMVYQGLETGDSESVTLESVWWSVHKQSFRIWT